MKTDEDIKIQIDRFMAGETSIEDEARLAEYFRTNIVKEELRPYQEMFAYFDRGMQDTHTHRRRVRPYLLSMAAAILVLLLLMIWPKAQPNQKIVQQIPSEMVNPVEISNKSTPDKAVRSTLQGKSVRSVYRRSHYTIRSSRKLMAINPVRTNEMNAATEQLIEEKMSSIEAGQEYILQLISALADTQNQGLELIVASMSANKNEDVY